MHYCIKIHENINLILDHFNFLLKISMKYHPKVAKIMKFSFLSSFILALLFTTITSLRVDPESSLFIDQYNRTTIFHGVNTVYKTFPFYPDT
jgi:hypothetical protein